VFQFQEFSSRKCSIDGDAAPAETSFRQPHPRRDGTKGIEMNTRTPTLSDDVHNKVVIVTGASSGIGEATALHLAERGARVVLAARRTDRLDKLVAHIRSEGGQAIAVATDVSRRQDLEKLAAAAIEAFGRIDVLVNNAGVMPLSPIDKLKVDEWDRTIDVNIKGVLYGIAAVLPQMKAQGGGHVINIASIAGIKVFTPIGTVYSATKHAVRAISEGLRIEAAPFGIRVTTVSPGAVESELRFGSTDPDATAGLKAFYEANQIPADAVARAVVYAVEQPANVGISEVLVRPLSQEF
jgi:NADP-dependent 3-hydroxy acid dehydrogenase YdfG